MSYCFFFTLDFKLIFFFTIKFFILSSLKIFTYVLLGSKQIILFICNFLRIRRHKYSYIRRGPGILNNPTNIVQTARADSEIEPR